MAMKKIQSRDMALENFDTLPDSAHVSPSTTAAVIGMSQATVWRMAKVGRLTPHKFTEKRTRFNLGEIRRLIALK